jgi:hypothetical protein
VRGAAAAIGDPSLVQRIRQERRRYGRLIGQGHEIARQCGAREVDEDDRLADAVVRTYP